VKTLYDEANNTGNQRGALNRFMKPVKLAQGMQSGYGAATAAFDKTDCLS
jgi:hypothetical protein